MVHNVVDKKREKKTYLSGGYKLLSFFIILQYDLVRPLLQIMHDIYLCEILLGQTEVTFISCSLIW